MHDGLILYRSELHASGQLPLFFKPTLLHACCAVNTFTHWQYSVCARPFFARIVPVQGSNSRM